jgi:hypothetical protein
MAILCEAAKFGEERDYLQHANYSYDSTRGNIKEEYYSHINYANRVIF